jgi:hypothetical protein
MAATPKPLIVRELLWLLVILVAAVPLSYLLGELIRQVPDLDNSLRRLVSVPAYVPLYVLVVLSCYMGRLGAYGAAYLARTVPQGA